MILLILPLLPLSSTASLQGASGQARSVVADKDWTVTTQTGRFPKLKFTTLHSNIINMSIFQYEIYDRPCFQTSIYDTD